MHIIKNGRLSDVESKPSKNGIYDGIKSSPTIYGVPNGGMKFIVNITEDFDTPDCYGDVISLLSNATELDEIVFNICSSGGYLSSLNMILGFKEMCLAKQTHVLFSEASSAATAFFLSPADQYIVGDRASFMIHEVQFGSGGTSANVRKHTDHVFKQNEKFVKDTYMDFLLDSEIDSILQGIELYFDADEIRKRLMAREDKRKERLQQDFDNEIAKQEDLSQYSDEELTEEITLCRQDIKDYQKELKKRKEIKK